MFPQHQDDYGGRDGYAYGCVSSDLRLLMYSLEVEDHSVHMYIDRHTVTQDRLPNLKKGHRESPVTLHHQSLDEPTSSKALHKYYM